MFCTENSESEYRKYEYFLDIIFVSVIETVQTNPTLVTTKLSALILKLWCACMKHEILVIVIGDGAELSPKILQKLMCSSSVVASEVFVIS